MFLTLSRHTNVFSSNTQQHHTGTWSLFVACRGGRGVCFAPLDRPCVCGGGGSTSRPGGETSLWQL